MYVLNALVAKKLKAQYPNDWQHQYALLKVKLAELLTQEGQEKCLCDDRSAVDTHLHVSLVGCSYNPSIVLALVDDATIARFLGVLLNEGWWNVLAFFCDDTKLVPVEHRRTIKVAPPSFCFWSPLQFFINFSCQYLLLSNHRYRI